MSPAAIWRQHISGADDEKRIQPRQWPLRYLVSGLSIIYTVVYVTLHPTVARTMKAVTYVVIYSMDDKRERNGGW